MKLDEENCLQQEAKYYYIYLVWSIHYIQTTEFGFRNNNILRAGNISFCRTQFQLLLGTSHFL